MSLEDQIRLIVTEELNKRQQAAEMLPVSEFCKLKKMSRSAVWRAEQLGKIQITRIGKKVFVKMDQF